MGGREHNEGYDRGPIPATRITLDTALFTGLLSSASDIQTAFDLLDPYFASNGDVQTEGVFRVTELQGAGNIRQLLSAGRPENGVFSWRSEGDTIDGVGFTVGRNGSATYPLYVNRVAATGATVFEVYADTSVFYDSVFFNDVIAPASGASVFLGTDANRFKGVYLTGENFIVGEKFSRSFVITNPTASSDLPLWRCPAAAVITAVHLLCKTQIIVGQLWEYDSNGLNGSAIDDSDITGVVDTNVNDDGTLANPSIAKDNYVGWKTTSAVAGATYAIITFEGYYN